MPPTRRPSTAPAIRYGIVSTNLAAKPFTIRRFVERRRSGEGKQRRIGNGREAGSMLREKGVANDFSLLLEPVAIEDLAWDDIVRVPAKRMPHHRKVKSATGLGLPHVREFVNQETLPVEARLREIIRPIGVCRVEVDIAGRRHNNAARLEGPPFASDQPDAGIIDAIPEHGSGEGDFTLSQGTRMLH